MLRKMTGLLAVLLTLAMVATACGSSSTAVAAGSLTPEEAKAQADAAVEAALAQDDADAQAAIDKAAEDARAEQAAENAAAVEAAREEGAAEGAAAAAAAAEDAASMQVRPFEGEVVKVTGPERSAEEWNAIESAMVPFEEMTGMEVIYTGSADWEAEINVQIAAGNPPDISIFPQPGKLADFAREGDIYELPADIFDSVSANWADAQMSFGNVDGAFYGVPLKNDLKSIVWHKPAFFEAQGYDYPNTWDELRDLTDTMILDGFTPWCVGIESGQATGWVFTDWTEDLMLRYHGPEAYDDWVSNDLKFDSPEVKQVMSEILELWNREGAVFAGGGSIASTHFASDPAEGLANDDCAMVRQASFFANFLPEGASEDVNVFYFPSIDGVSSPVMGGGNLTGAFNEREATWAVMEYFGSAEYANARQIAQREAKDGGVSGFNTANLNADKSLWTPMGASFVQFLQDAEIFRFDGSDLMPADVGAGEFWTQATAMVNGEVTVDEGAAAIDAAWPSDG